MTNLDHLLKGIEKAKVEKMQIYKHGAPASEGYVVIHQKIAYNVEVKDGQVSKCSCPHHHFRGVICKHMVKVSMQYNLNIAGLSVETEGSKEQELKEAK
jgi:hypothetical protein